MFAGFCRPGKPSIGYPMENDMGLFKDLFHVAGNMVAVTQLTAKVRAIILANIGVDIASLPEPLRSSIHDRIKQEFLDGNQSVADIASSLTLSLIAATSAPIHSVAQGGQGTIFEEARAASSTLIAASYRELARQLNLAPTSRTSDEEIIETYRRVGTAFQQAAEKRGERLSADILGGIVFAFLQIKESHGDEFEKEHLDYEIQLYGREGLRDDYKNGGINLLGVLGHDT